MHPEIFIQQYERALQSADWKNVAPLIAEHACVTFSTGAVHKGKAAIQAAYESNFASIRNEVFAITDVHWVDVNELTAIYTFKFNWRGTINEQVASGSGHGTAVIKLIDGSWQLITEHLGK